MGNVKPNGWRMASGQTRRGRSNKTKFARSMPMKSIKAMQAQQLNDDQEEIRRSCEESEQLEGAFIIAKGELVPEEIREDGFFEPIVKETGCNIEESPSTGGAFMLILRSRDKMQMDAAHNAIVRKLEALRQIRRSFSRTLVLQPPARSDYSTLVSMKASERPLVIGKNFMRGPSAADCPAVLSSLLGRLAISMPEAAFGAIHLTHKHHLEMRIAFGRLNIEKKKRDVPDELSYAAFETALKPYQTRGHATLATRLADLQNVDKAIELFTCPGGPGSPIAECTYKNELIMTIRENDTQADLRAVILKDRLGHLSMEQPVTVAHLDWWVIAPEEDFDWMLRIGSTIPQDMPARYVNYLENLRFDWTSDEELEAFSFPRPRSRRPSAVAGLRVFKTCVKSSLVIPLARRPYVLEISVTRQWDDALSVEPLTTWSIEMYCEHWEEAMNYMGKDGRDWGPDFSNVWHQEARGQGLEQRLNDFILCILTVLDRLRGLNADEEEDKEEQHYGFKEEMGTLNQNLMDQDFLGPLDVPINAEQASDAMSSLLGNIHLSSGHQKEDGGYGTESSDDLIEL